MCVSAHICVHTCNVVRVYSEKWFWFGESRAKKFGLWKSFKCSTCLLGWKCQDALRVNMVSEKLPPAAAPHVTSALTESWSWKKPPNARGLLLPYLQADAGWLACCSPCIHAQRALLEGVMATWRLLWETREYCGLFVKFPLLPVHNNLSLLNPSRT